MTVEQRKAYRGFVRERYTKRRRLAHALFWPESLTDAQLDHCYHWASLPDSTRSPRPVGFGPVVWLMIGKVIIELLMLWFSAENAALEAKLNIAEAKRKTKAN